MTDSNLTNGCKKATETYDVILTADQLVQIQLALNDRIEKLTALISPEYDSENLRKQVEFARDGLEAARQAILRRA